MLVVHLKPLALEIIHVADIVSCEKQKIRVQGVPKSFALQSCRDACAARGASAEYHTFVNGAKG